MLDVIIARMQNIEEYSQNILQSVGCSTIEGAFKQLGLQRENSGLSLWRNGLRKVEHPLLRITAAGMVANDANTPVTNQKITKLINTLNSSIEISTQGTIKPVEIDNNQRYILRTLRASAGLSKEASNTYLGAIRVLQNEYAGRPKSTQNSPRIFSIPTDSVLAANRYISKEISAPPTLALINMYLAIHCYAYLIETGIWDSEGTQLPITSRVLNQKALLGNLSKDMYQTLELESGEPTNEGTLSIMWKFIKEDIINHASKL